MRIKARQGHSNIEVTELELIEVTDINLKIYHGTTSEYTNSILKNGLIRGERLHVHWTESLELAKKRANQKTKNGRIPTIWSLNIEKYLESGGKLYKSNNDVYLTNDIPAEFLYLTIDINLSKDEQERQLKELMNDYKEIINFNKNNI